MCVVAQKKVACIISLYTYIIHIHEVKSTISSNKILSTKLNFKFLTSLTLKQQKNTILFVQKHLGEF